MPAIKSIWDLGIKESLFKWMLGIIFQRSVNEIMNSFSECSLLDKNKSKMPVNFRQLPLRYRARVSPQPFIHLLKFNVSVVLVKSSRYLANLFEIRRKLRESESIFFVIVLLHQYVVKKNSFDRLSTLLYRLLWKWAKLFFHWIY